MTYSLFGSNASEPAFALKASLLTFVCCLATGCFPFVQGSSITGMEHCLFAFSVFQLIFLLQQWFFQNGANVLFFFFLHCEGFFLPLV
jgi:hypothetical protein